MSLQKLNLILGGAASGKSAFAEDLLVKSGKDLVYIATAQVWDDEMAEKVVQHKAMRGAGWTTIEEPLDLPQVLQTITDNQAVLIDCATLWLTNLILGEHDVSKATSGLLKAVAACPAPIVIVSNEVGQGFVPDNALSRQFRNAQGRLNQDIAAQAQQVVAVMAGRQLKNRLICHKCYKR
jgi:adenosylcobinamide kinase/adenosylcobinamide-phosphate guanylyltransferase